MGIFSNKRNSTSLSKTSTRNYSNFNLPDSGTLSMPDFFWLKKNQDSQRYIDSRIEELANIAEISSAIYKSIEPLIPQIIEKIDADAMDSGTVKKIGEACYYGGFLAYVELESGQAKNGLVHPAINSSMIFFGVLDGVNKDPNISQGINVSVQVGYARIRFPDIPTAELLANIYKIV